MRPLSAGCCSSSGPSEHVSYAVVAILFRLGVCRRHWSNQNLYFWRTSGLPSCFCVDAQRVMHTRYSSQLSFHERPLFSFSAARYLLTIENLMQATAVLPYYPVSWCLCCLHLCFYINFPEMKTKRTRASCTMTQTADSQREGSIR